MSDKKTSNLAIKSFATGAVLILAVFIFAAIFPGFKITSLTKNITLFVLMCPWFVFIYALIFSGKSK